MTIRRYEDADGTDLTPDSSFLQALQHEAGRDGRAVVVGAVIIDAMGRAFVHRRAPDRRLFPNCWDIAGGHVDPGETIYAALTREVWEETGWRVVKLLALIDSCDWEAEQDGHPRCRRELDFLVTVSGDLDHPLLEEGKATEYRWITPMELDLLKENRTVDDLTVYRIVKNGLAQSDDKLP